MSKFNYKVLAAAVALGITGVAGAAEVQTNANTPAAYVHAREVTGAALADRTAYNNGAIDYTMSQGDKALFIKDAVTVTLKLTGAKFDAAGVAVTPSQHGTIGDTAVNDPDDVVTVTPAASGTVAEFTFTPNDASLGISAGSLFSLAKGALKLNSISAADGGQVTLEVTVSNPTTGVVFDKASAVVLTVKDATKNAVSAKLASDISVGGGVDNAPRTIFMNGFYTPVGAVKIGTVPFDSAGAAASAFGSGATNNIAGTGAFQYAAADKVVLELTAPKSASFLESEEGADEDGYNTDDIGFFAITGATCDAAAVAGGVQLVADETDATLFSGSVDATDAAAGMTICAGVNGVDPIEAQTLSLSSSIKLADVNARQPEAVVGNLATLKNNGSSVPVMHFNPASNVDQQSYLRISNTYALPGVVRIVAVDDAGKKAATTVSFTLPAGQSMLVTAADLENGNAAKGIATGIGAPTQGKWRLTVSAEVPSGNLVVQNFLRNTTSAGVINTNVNNNN